MGPRVVGFDPGELYTGWALIYYGGNERIPSWREFSISTGLFTSWNNIDTLLERGKPTLVVCEDYRLYPSKARAQFGSQVKAIRTIGVIQYLCQQHNVQFVEQAASRIRKDPLVKDVKVAGTVHENDALKHALVQWYKSEGVYKRPHD